jgi:hypothetical protein
MSLNPTITPGLENGQTPAATQGVPVDAAAVAGAPIQGATPEGPKGPAAPTVSADDAAKLAASAARITELVGNGTVKAGEALKKALATGDFSGVSEKQGGFILKALDPNAPAPAPRAPAVESAVTVAFKADAETIGKLAEAGAIKSTAGLKAGIETGDFSRVSPKQAEIVKDIIGNLKASGLSVEEFVKTLKAETKNSPATPKKPGLEMEVSDGAMEWAGKMLADTPSTGDRIVKAFGQEAFDAIQAKLAGGGKLNFRELLVVKNCRDAARINDSAERIMGTPSLKKAMVVLSKALDDVFKNNTNFKRLPVLGKEGFLALKDTMKQDPKSAALLLAGTDHNAYNQKLANDPEKKVEFGFFDEAPSAARAFNHGINTLRADVREKGVKLTPELVISDLPVQFRNALEVANNAILKAIAPVRPARAAGPESPTSGARTISPSAQKTVEAAIKANPAMDGWPESAKDLVARQVPPSEWTYKVYKEFQEATGLKTAMPERKAVEPTADRTFGSDSKTFAKLKELVEAGKGQDIPEAVMAKIKDGLAKGAVTMTQGEYTESVRAAAWPPAEA